MLDKEDCNECENCRFVDYVADEPTTHCVNCDCLFCLPGA